MYLEHCTGAHHCCDYSFKNETYFSFQYDKFKITYYLLQSVLLFRVNKQMNIQVITFLTHLKFHYLRMSIYI